MDEIRLRDIDAFIGAEKNHIIRDIARLVAINSVEGKPEEGAPYGRAAREALGLPVPQDRGAVLPLGVLLVLFASAHAGGFYHDRGFRTRTNRGRESAATRNFSLALRG